MRILTGKYKGKTILMPKGIRPTQNKVRKALFDILGDIKGLSFLELFAGSASVGLEAASNGVTELILVESNRQCQIVIKKNIEALGLSDICVLLPQDTQSAIERLNKNKKRIDIIFLDPPYCKGGANPPTNCEFNQSSSTIGGGVKKTLQMLGAYDILAPNGLIVTQHFKKDDLPSKLGDLILFKQAEYGDTLLSFYKKQESV